MFFIFHEHKKELKKSREETWISKNGVKDVKLTTVTSRASGSAGVMISSDIYESDDVKIRGPLNSLIFKRKNHHDVFD